MLHYKRARAGKPLTDARPEVGSVSGFGRYGVFDDDGDTVLCHECGRRLRSLSVHLSKAHDGLTAREYKIIHGLPLGTALLSRNVRQAQSARAAANVGSQGWSRLEQARDPLSASHSRTPESFIKRGEHVAEYAARARDNGGRTRGVVHSCFVCGAMFCRIPGTPARKTCDDRCAAAAIAWTSAGHQNPERDEHIKRLIAQGQSRLEVAEMFNLSRERIGQIVNGTTANARNQYRKPRLGNL